MSASIMWAPKAKGKDLPVSAPSRFIEQLQAAFGNFPNELSLDAGSLPVLRGMMAGGAEKEPILKLIDAIEEHDEIKVWAEW